MDRTDRRLAGIAAEVRRSIIRTACASRTPHVGSSLSCADLLVELYFREMDISAENWKDRDIFILSKGHAALALYAVLTQKGLMSKAVLEGYYRNDGTLPAHPDKFTHKAVEASTGALGHGFSMALGMAYGYKLKREKRRFFTLIGDGESQEGSVWEGALFASKLGVDNLTAILDYNNLQGYGKPRELCRFEPVAEKWKAFGWETVRVNGHDFSALRAAFRRPHKGKPKMIIAETTKGKGVGFMENELKWHYYIVTEEIRDKALEGLRGRGS